MVDPISGAFIAKAVAGAAASKLTGGALAKAIEALQGPELGRVLDAVDEELGTGVGTAGLTFLRDEPEIALLIAAYLSDRTTWDEAVVVSLIEPHVGPGAEGTAADYARTVARAIERNAFMAQHDKTAAIVREVQAVRSDLRRLVGPSGSDALISGDALPREALAPIEDLAATYPAEAESLRLSLANEATRIGEVRGLASNPPAWLAEGSWALWATVGEIAQAFGLMGVAERATQEAADLPGADRARMFARASQLARTQGDNDRAEELLRQARSINSDHPTVRYVEATLLPDPQAQLDMLENIEPLNARQAAAFEVMRALCHLALDQMDEAWAAAVRAGQLNIDSPAVRELEPLLTLISNQRRVRDDQVDTSAVNTAAEQFLALGDEIRALGRHAEANAMRGRAAEAFTLAGERGRAVALLGSITDDERQALDEATARQLAVASLEARRPDIAERYLQAAGDNDAARLVRAQVEVHQGPERARAVIEDLDELLGSGDAAVREQAALVRLLVFFLVDEVEWSAPAEQIVRDVDAVIADAFVASRQAQEGDIAGARALLVLHGDDPRALRALVDLAEQVEDWASAVEIQTSLTDREPTPSRRLRLAELLSHSGRIQDSEQILDLLSRDSTAPADLRSEATARLAELVWRAKRYGDLADVTGRWLELNPRSPAAAWGNVLALTLLSRHEEARRVIQDRALEPRDDRDALLAAHVFRRTLETSDALQRIIELSDRFDRKVEGLEAMVIYAGIGPREHEIPEGLQARRAESFAEFAQRFPDSTFIKAIPAPESPEEVEAFMREHFSPGAQQLADLHGQMVRGETAVAVLAAFVGKHLPQVWARLGALPLEFGDPALREIERQAARDAIGRSVVWESSAMFIAGGLGGEIEAIVGRALPGSVIAQSVLDDASAGADQPFGDEEGLELGWDASDDRPRITEISSDQREIDRVSSEGVLRIARSFRVVPDTASGSPGRFDEFLADDGEKTTDLALRTWVSSSAVADRLGIPLYSDDRFIRAHAHGAGISTFGTRALLDALVERSLLDESGRDRALRRLRLTGAMGLAPDLEQLVKEAEEAEWDVTQLVARALFDPTAWRDAAAISRHVSFLWQAYQRRPDAFPKWVARVYDAGTRAVNAEQGRSIAPSLLVLAWVVGEPEFAGELLRILRELQPVEDPLVRAFNILGLVTADVPPAVRVRAIQQAFASVEHTDQIRLFGLLRFE